jgi:undecaprenyl diphosphate synthase
MELFVIALEQEVAKLHENRIKLKVVGDLSSFEPRLNRMIVEAETLTAANDRLTLTIAANYGGRWDILQAVNRMAASLIQPVDGYCEAHLAPYLAMNYAPEPDLFVRTGGEQRISNFLLWQLAYTEFYFTDELWPDFNAQSLNLAIESYRSRERRFGRTSEQLAGEAAQPDPLRESGGDSR